MLFAQPILRALSSCVRKGGAWQGRLRIDLPLEQRLAQSAVRLAQAHEVRPGGYGLVAERDGALEAMDRCPGAEGG
jgi:hypothetical protein